MFIQTSKSAEIVTGTWFCEVPSSRIMAEQETLEGGEMGTLACPVRDTLLDQTTEQKLGHIGLPW